MRKARPASGGKLIVIFRRPCDSFVCYQKLQDNIQFINRTASGRSKRMQEKRCKLLEEMLAGYDDGRSKSFYCIAATVFEIAELEQALASADASSAGMPIKEKARVMRRVLESIAKEKALLPCP